MARQPKKWHPEDIKAEVWKRGKTLSRIALDAGLDRSACRVALRRPYYAAEQAIAKCIGVAAHRLWPDRYDAEGRSRLHRNRLRHSRTLGRPAPRMRRRVA